MGWEEVEHVRVAATQNPRSHFLTFNLTPLFLAKLRNSYFVTLFVTMGRRFRATIGETRLVALWMREPAVAKPAQSEAVRPQ